MLPPTRLAGRCPFADPGGRAGVLSCELQSGGAAMRIRSPLGEFVATAASCLVATVAGAQVVKDNVPGIRNLAKVESTVACAGAITPESVATIKKMGYRSIINLRLADEP